MESKADKAKTLFLSGANCAQAVLCAFHEECGLSLDEAMRLASGFGGGMARLREVCGAVSGMFLAADLMFGPSDPKDKPAKDAHYAFLQKLAGEFREKTGSIVCRELLGLSPKQTDSPVSESRTPAYYQKRPCAEMVALAAGILEKSLSGRPKRSV